jgi:hypothetical protein
MADTRSWSSLGIVAVIALFTTLNWPWLAWFWGVGTLLLFLRAGALVLSARNAGADPEEHLHDDDSDAPPTQR